MRTDARSNCPISLALEIFGDRWTLLVVRDLMFEGKRHFREMLQSEERISSNILADRLGTLLEHGIVTRADDPSHKQKAVYSLTEKGIALLPVMIQIGLWSSKYRPVSEKAIARAAFLEKGGPALWDRMAADLRQAHLGAPAAGRSEAAAE